MVEPAKNPQRTPFERDRARAQGINFSKTLHDALLEKIG